MFDLEEKTISSETVYEGPIFHVERHVVSLPNGRQTKREVVRNTNAVAVVAVNEDNQVILVHQYRKPADRVMTEIPAGKLEIGEDPREGALRELEEETVYTAGKIDLLLTYRGSVGFLAEAIYIYYARDLVYTHPHPDEGEFVETELMDLHAAKLACLRGDFEDGKTIVGILLAADRREQGE